jgi:hypothetical protein
MRDAPGTTDTDDWLSRLVPEPRAAAKKKQVAAKKKR